MFKEASPAIGDEFTVMPRRESISGAWLIHGSEQFE